MRPAGGHELKERYHQFANDEVLALAVSRGLTDAARRILADELERRGLTSGEVEAYRKYRRKAEALDPKAEAHDPESQSISYQDDHGWGTFLMFKRDYRPDGSYVVTKWATVWWIPVFPLQCLRVRPVSGGYEVLDVWGPFERRGPSI